MENFENNEFISSNSDENTPGFNNINRNTSEVNDSFNEGFRDNDVSANNTPEEFFSDSQYSGYTVTPQGGYYDNNPYDYSYDVPPTEQSVNSAPVFVPPPPTPVKKEKRRHSTAVVILSSVLAAIIGFGGCFAAMYFLNDEDGRTTLIERIISSDDDNDSGTNTSNVSINVDESVNSVAQAVAQKATDSVVGIRVSVSGGFGSSSGGEGSGVVYSEDGYIITNYHVIEYGVKYSNSKIEVFFGDASTDSYIASVVGYNIASDLAVIKIDADNLKAAELGDSDKLNVGQYVVTIGSPGGLEFMGSVTYGIISGLNRQVSSDSDIGLIQTDAAINPGNSGGALLDSTGKLIGINSSKIVSEEFEGMGFAIPVNTVKEVCGNIIANKDKAEPYIGITINERYTAEVLERYGYPAGAVVYSVASGSPADEAGLRRNDIITEFNGHDVTEYSILPGLVDECEPGDRVQVTVYRSGRSMSLNITVGSNTAG